jgi:uncharacterized SAM-binding protein YcdF (DUF218 family)
LYIKYYYIFTFITGNIVYNEEISEASAMEIWLSKNGVAADKILEEDKSSNTYENLKFSKPIMEKIRNAELILERVVKVW